MFRTLLYGVLLASIATTVVAATPNGPQADLMIEVDGTGFDAWQPMEAEAGDTMSGYCAGYARMESVSSQECIVAMYQANPGNFPESPTKESDFWLIEGVTYLFPTSLEAITNAPAAMTVGELDALMLRISGLASGAVSARDELAAAKAEALAAVQATREALEPRLAAVEADIEQVIKPRLEEIADVDEAQAGLLDTLVDGASTHGTELATLRSELDALKTEVETLKENKVAAMDR